MNPRVLLSEGCYMLLGAWVLGCAASSERVRLRVRWPLSLFCHGTLARRKPGCLRRQREDRTAHYHTPRGRDIPTQQRVFTTACPAACPI